jgi:hypothetical protein
MKCKKSMHSSFETCLCLGVMTDTIRVTRWVWKNRLNVAQLIFCTKCIHNFYLGKKSLLKSCATFETFKQLPKIHKPPNRWKFAQSGHPGCNEGRCVGPQTTIWCRLLLHSLGKGGKGTSSDVTGFQIRFFSRKQICIRSTYRAVWPDVSVKKSPKMLPNTFLSKWILHRGTK